MSIFRFKQFEISDDNCAMKVGTDAVLIGAWSGAKGNIAGEGQLQIKQILDIGTGCGVLALMMAQQYDCQIDAVEIDKNSCLTAIKNFDGSPWKSRLELYKSSFQDYIKQCKKHYDLIISNPPFFRKSILNREGQRTIARHQVLLGFEDIFSGVDRILGTEGIFNLIYPVISDESIIRESKKNSLYFFRKTSVIPKQGKEPNRIMASFGRDNVETIFDELIIRNADNSFSEDYKNLTRDFYIIF